MTNIEIGICQKTLKLILIINIKQMKVSNDKYVMFFLI